MSSSLSALQKSMRGKSKLEREAILSKEAESMTGTEKDLYRNFYEKAQLELKTKRTVTSVIIGLSRAVFLQNERLFQLQYELSCAVTGNPIQTPKEAMKEARKRKRYKLGTGARNPAILDKCRLAYNKNNRYGLTRRVGERLD